MDFPLYGLDTSWPGARWIESFGEAIGNPVHWVSLGHQSPGGESLVYVETFSRPRIDAHAATSIETPPQDVAFYATALLINATLPVASLPRPDGLIRAAVDHANERSSQCAQWPQVRWQVDGVAVTARIWWFAGGWAAVSDAVEGVYLAAVGVGIDPDGLSLAVLADGDAYHFELDQPMHTPVMVTSHAARTDGDPPPPRREDWHPDQLQLMRQRGHNTVE
ncbi:MAG: hypothetical protein ABSA02_32455 [Trebonia sp.]